MRLRTMSAIVIAGLSTALLVGCPNPQSVAPTASRYPTDAAAVTADPAYKFGFFSGLTGATYYVRRVSKDEIAAMPKECVISDGNTSVLVVPIKDGKIVEFGNAARVAEFFSQTPDEMLKDRGNPPGVSN